MAVVLMFSTRESTTGVAPGFYIVYWVLYWMMNSKPMKDEPPKLLRKRRRKGAFKQKNMGLPRWNKNNEINKIVYPGLVTVQQVHGGNLFVVHME